MWDDVRVNATQALRNAIPTKASNGEKFVYSVFFTRDLFYHYTRKYFGKTGDNHRTSGEWTVFRIVKGSGLRVLCAILKLKKLPMRIQDGNSIELHTVTELGYHMKRRRMRVRGTLKTDVVE